MMNQEKLKKLSLKLSSDRSDYISCFRKNLDLYVQEKDITLREISEASDIAYSTLNSFLYGDAADCKLSTAVALARALNVSIDELVGAETLEPLTRESIAMCRNLPQNAVHLIRWHIRHQHYLCNEVHKDKRIINIMNATCQNSGNLKLSNDYALLDISELSPEITRKTFFGIRIPCDHYMPHYMRNDILLIANDRTPEPYENAILILNDSLYFARRRVENGVAKYYSIRDGKYRIDEADVDEILGYVTDVYQDMSPSAAL